MYVHWLVCWLDDFVVILTFAFWGNRRKDKTDLQLAVSPHPYVQVNE